MAHPGVIASKVIQGCIAEPSFGVRSIALLLLNDFPHQVGCYQFFLQTC